MEVDDPSVRPPSVDLEPALAEDELAHMAMSFDLDVEAFLMEAENFRQIDHNSLHIPLPNEELAGGNFRRQVLNNLADFFDSWPNRASVAVGGLFVLMLVLFKPVEVIVDEGLKELEFNMLVKKEEVRIKTPPPTPEPTPTPPPTPTQIPKLTLQKQPNKEMRIKLKTAQRYQRPLSNATAKLSIRNVADDTMPDISKEFVTGRNDDPDVAVNLTNIGNGHRNGGDKNGVTIKGLGDSHRGDPDKGRIKPTLTRVGRNQPIVSKANGNWVKLTSFGPVAGLQVKCHRNPGIHIYGKYKIQCGKNIILAAWEKM